MDKMRVLLHDTLMKKLTELEQDIIACSCDAPSVEIDAKLSTIHEVRNIAEQAKMPLDMIPKGGAVIFSYPGCDIDEDFNPILKGLDDHNIMGIVMSDMVDICRYDSIEDAILYLHAKIVSIDERRQKRQEDHNESF